MKHSLVIALAFVGIFFSGAVVGGMVTFRWGGKVRQERAFEQFAAQNLKQLGEVLDLTAEQRQTLRPLLVNAAKELSAQRKQNQSNIQKLGDKLDGEVRVHLTEEQKTKLDDFRVKRRDRDKRWSEYIRALRAKRGGEPPPLPDNPEKIED